jgi:hypothetical protein
MALAKPVGRSAKIGSNIAANGLNDSLLQGENRDPVNGNIFIWSLIDKKPKTQISFQAA